MLEAGKALCVGVGHGYSYGRTGRQARQGSTLRSHLILDKHHLGLWPCLPGSRDSPSGDPGKRTTHFGMEREHHPVVAAGKQIICSGIQQTLSRHSAVCLLALPCLSLRQTCRGRGADVQSPIARIPYALERSQGPAK